MGRRSLTLFTLVALLGAPGLAHAGGFEFAAPGTRALGRGGAFTARADDPMALGYNPAALAFLPGYQLMLGSHVSFYDSCVDRSGMDAGGQELPQVCRSGYPGPSPQLVFTGHPIPEVGFGVGILAPSAVGNGHWGRDDGTLDGTIPTPTRYTVVSQDLLLFHPTIGIGVSPVEWLSLGVSLQWGMAVVGFTNYTSAGVLGDEDSTQEVRTELHAEDWFVPAVIVSAHFVPIDELDIVATARFSDGIDGGGSLTLTGEEGIGEIGTFDTRLQAGQPWQFGLAVRYSDRRQDRYRDPDEAGRVTGRVEDAMQNEIWDIELDVVYHHNGQVRDFVVTPDPASGLAALPLPHGWQDQVSVRVGGDWNILPGQLAARIGAHWESSGVNATYQTQDFLPGMRLGLHLGATVRIDRFDVSLAYAHIFQFDETITNGNYRLIAPYSISGEHECAGSPDYDPNNPVTSRGCYPAGFGAAVNSGTYTGEFNVVSLQARYHFQ